MTKPAVEFLKGLAQHLRDLRDAIIRSRQVQVVRWDPTFGVSVAIEHFEVIDFDELLEEIDAFSRTFEDSK
jgi:hypothetical protein